jgi:hypothetical protein
MTKITTADNTDRFVVASDFETNDHGSVWRVTPQNEIASAWIDENVHEPQFWGRALIVEARYVTDLLDGIRDAGLSIVGEE